MEDGLKPQYGEEAHNESNAQFFDSKVQDVSPFRGEAESQSRRQLQKDQRYEEKESASEPGAKK